MQSVAPVVTQPDGSQSSVVGQGQGFAPGTGPQTIPIAQYIPAFANVVPMDPYNGIPADITGIINAAHTLQVRQQVKLLPKTCCSCPPCPKQENTYSVYAGFTEAEANEFLRVDEVSDDWNRCCCAPYHPLKLEVRQYIPPPGSSTNTSEFQHIWGDVGRDWDRFSKVDKAAKLKEQYSHYPPLFTVERTDGMRCCFKFPCKCLNACVCFACCQDGARVYAGPVAEVPDVEKGRPMPGTQNFLMGSIIQPIFGGWCKPELHMYGEGGEASASEPYGRIRGPCFFGGWIEMCCSFKFLTSFYNSPSDSGDIAVITKKKPTNLASAIKELSTDSDSYAIEFNPQAQLGIAQKTTVLAAQLLADYMWFEGNTEKCRMDRDGCTCYICYCSLIGKLVPCYIYIPYNSGG